MAEPDHHFKAPLDATPALWGTKKTARSLGQVEFAVREDIAIASIALRNSVHPPMPFALALPQPGWCSLERGMTALWSCPDQWLLMADGKADIDFSTQVKEAYPDASVTEQTDAWVVVDLTWSDEGVFPELLARLANLNPSSLEPDMGTRTLVHHMGCHLLRPSRNRLRVLGMRSSAGYLFHAVETVVRNLTASISGGDQPQP